MNANEGKSKVPKKGMRVCMEIFRRLEMENSLPQMWDKRDDKQEKLASLP